jgi:hypothetical protein
MADAAVAAYGEEYSGGSCEKDGEEAAVAAAVVVGSGELAREA